MIGKDTRVIYVPSARSPFKSSLPTANDHRTGMLEIALHNQCDWEIWEQELQDEPMNPDQPSYWADTWSIVQQMNLPGTNRFLIGADQMLSMHRWRRYEEFWKDAAVMLRQESDSIDTLIEQMIALDVWSDQNIEHWKHQIISVPTIDASSTSIRDAIMNPLTRNIPAEGLDPDVQAYILEHDLYCETD